MKTTYHALVLNLHQPAGNLQELLEYQPWDTEQILFAMDRMPRTLLPYEDIARVHLSMSGTLLETLADPEFQQRVYGTVDCGSLLWQLQNKRIFNILGSGYYHPVLPLIPEADRKEHLLRWRGIAEHQFWRTNFEGFWPPEMSFSMELIPLIKQMGYQYVLVDSANVEASRRCRGQNYAIVRTSLNMVMTRLSWWCVIVNCRMLRNQEWTMTGSPTK
jgi:hypothetical protein